MIDLDAALAAAKRPQRTVHLCLRGDLVAEIELLDEQLAEAEKANAGNLAPTAGLKRMRKRRDELATEAEAANYPFVVTGLNDPEWRTLVAAHDTPREGNVLDEMFGFNTDTFFPEFVRRSLGSTVTDAQWAKLSEVLSSGQMEQLRDACMEVSRRKASVPKSRPSSDARQKSDET